MRILIAIKSCQEHMLAGYHDAIRQSWALFLPEHVDLRFFVGGSSSIATSSDEVELDCQDSYEMLPWKTKAIAEWSHTQGYDFSFLCDNDTFVHPSRLLDEKFDFDYRGRMYFQSPIPWEIQGNRFAFGGTGYWLSKYACSIVAMSTPFTPSEPQEDRFVGRVLRQIPGLKWSEANLDRWERHVAWHYTKGAYPEAPKYTPSTHWQTRMTNKHILGLPTPNLAPIDRKTFPDLPSGVDPNALCPQLNPFVVVAKMKNLFETSTTPELLISLAASLEIQKKIMGNITYVEWAALAKTYLLLGYKQPGIHAQLISESQNVVD